MDFRGFFGELNVEKNMNKMTKYVKEYNIIKTKIIPKIIHALKNIVEYL
jgi:hypothetical protein